MNSALPAVVLDSAAKCVEFGLCPKRMKRGYTLHVVLTVDELAWLSSWLGFDRLITPTELSNAVQALLEERAAREGQNYR